MQVRNKNIFFDLDGTLIDVKVRLYNLFVELAPQNQFSLDKYWEIKRNRVDQANLLSKYFGYSESQIVEFKKMWLSKIEDKERLMLDIPFPKSGLLLRKLSKNNCLYIVTNRQHKDLAIEQVNSYGWTVYIKEILVTMQKTSKLFLIKENVKTTKDDVFIGDTGEDMLTGQKLGAKTIGVASGFLNKNILSEYNPNLIVDNIEEIYKKSTLLLK